MKKKSENSDNFSNKLLHEPSYTMKTKKKEHLDQDNLKLESELMAELTDIINEHEASLLRYAYRILRDIEYARDIVQETFIRLVKAWREGKKDIISNVKAWLFRITRNLCLDHLRSSKVKHEMPIEENFDNVASHDTPDSKLVKEETIRLVRGEIMKLDSRAREIVILKIDHDKSYKEIAEIMDLSVSNVGFILHQSMKKIAKEMRESI